MRSREGETDRVTYTGPMMMPAAVLAAVNELPAPRAMSFADNMGKVTLTFPSPP